MGFGIFDFGILGFYDFWILDFRILGLLFCFDFRTLGFLDFFWIFELLIFCFFFVCWDVGTFGFWILDVEFGFWILRFYDFGVWDFMTFGFWFFVC